MLGRLGLGTVQFGMHYGVSNRLGPPGETEIAAILERAVALGVGYLDTAFAYPNSEALIGRHLASGSSLKIVTKTAPIASLGTGRDRKATILDAVASSMDRLRVDRLYGLLVHHATDLGKPGWESLVEALDEARSRGWVSHIGASVYNEFELELVESRFRPGIVQGPINVLDTRLLSSRCFARLKAGGTEMHARSVFLQGLLLMQPSTLPAFFAPVKAALASLQASWAEQGISPLAACLAFVLEQSDIDAAIVGVNSLREFKEVQLAATSRPVERDIRLKSGPSIDPRFLDPSLWPSFAL
jgi:aryl-alcohol dehydrogenase-like predicted oxidoreductase